MIILRLRGFTIMELLIASALASVLMIGILFATTQQAKQTQRMQKRTPATAFDSVLQLFHRDLMQATACRITENKIHLQGFILLEEHTQKQTQQPAEVIYHLTEIDGSNWLIRHQRELQNLTLDDHAANLVCQGITTMQLVALLPPEVSEQDISSENNAPLENSSANVLATTSDNNSDKDDTQALLEITDQWQPLPQVVQWIVTQTKPSDADEIHSDQNNTRTYTLVLQ